MKTTSVRGLSLVEVLLAVLVLAIGVFGVAQLQASTLRASSKSESLQDVTGIARNEIEARLQYALYPQSKSDCVTTVPDTYLCSVTVSACGIASGALVCEGFSGSGVGFEIAATVTGNRGDSVTLRSFSGSAVGPVGGLPTPEGEDNGSGESDNGNGESGGDEGGSDPDPDPDPNPDPPPPPPPPDCWPPTKKACR